MKVCYSTDNPLYPPIPNHLYDFDTATDSRILDNLDQLYQVGYVWRVGGFDYEPGIHSLMNYVRGNSLESNKQSQKLREAHEIPDTGVEM